MLSCLVGTALSLGVFQSSITRDAYGVPRVVAPSLVAAVELQGEAVAQDRLWQMENSRRLAQGQMAEVFGDAYVASDTEYAKTGYTTLEIEAQIRQLSPKSQELMVAYAKGVNKAIADMKAAGKLPDGYKTNGFEPRPWTVVDSAAITIRLFQQFGQGGAGELRNLALLLYLQGRSNKEQALDIFDDFLWRNDARSPVTVSAENMKPSPETASMRTNWDRATLENHLKSIPKVSLGEILPAIRLASRETQELVAEHHAVPYKMGSYAIVVSPSRSVTGEALLLSAPQMGHTTPSIIHESCLVGFAAGMDVPGIPGIAIGHTPNMAWALTSGVADTIDIVYNRFDSESEYLIGTKRQKFEVVPMPVKVKGKPDVAIVQKRTEFGPVIATSNSGKAVFSQRASHWMKELQSFDALLGCLEATKSADLEAPLRRATVSFNFHYAFKSGEIGYRYLALVPKRSDSIDPRLPAPGDTDHGWTGFIEFNAMPSMTNPKSGLITNWNNKPINWWNNSDTPVWGRTFRVETLRNSIPDRLLSMRDVELAAWWIARKDVDWVQLGPIVRKSLERLGRKDVFAKMLATYDGLKTDGSPQAVLATQFVDALRTEIFTNTTGNFLSPATFRTVTQIHVLLEALEGKTKVRYLGTRSADEVIGAALDRAVERLKSKEPNPSDWYFKPGSINIPNQAPVPYSDRGTYIQLITLPANGTVFGRSVASPGMAEVGPHAFDQVPLARAFTFKPIQKLSP